MEEQTSIDTKIYGEIHKVVLSSFIKTLVEKILLVSMKNLIL